MTAEMNTKTHNLKVVLRSKNTFIFSSDFKTLFTKQSPREILDLNFEKKTIYLNFNFPIYWSAIITPKKETMTSVTQLIMQNMP